MTEYGVRGIVKNFGGVQALIDLTMSFQPGSVHCLAGENGSGKSTLIKIMSGVERPDAGTIIVGGHEYSHFQPPEALAAGVQVIFQDFSLLPNLTVAENIALGTELASGKKFITQRHNLEIAVAAMSRIGVELDPFSLVSDIPVAAKQLVAIARAINQDVKLLFMDEPTTALTRREVQRLFSVVEQLKERGVATVFVSHKMDEMQEIADTISILRNGRLVDEGPMADFDRKRIATAMTGQEVTDHREVLPLDPNAPTVLDVQGLSRTGAFNDVSFTVKAGEILGITGLLGSGRTEIAEALFGLQPATAGQISINGAPVTIKNPQQAVSAGIGYVPEDRLTEGLFLDQSIGRNIIAASLRTFARLGLLKRTAMNDAIDAAVTNFRIKTPDPRNAVNSLSGGNQQRVVLSKWLAQNPQVFVLNGPTVGVDIGSKKEIMDIIREQARSGMAIIVISDDIPELVQVAHRILVVRQGQITASVDDAEISTARLYEELAA
jgi:simple sugar transport system ATP-binding protein